VNIRNLVLIIVEVIEISTNLLTLDITFTDPPVVHESQAENPDLDRPQYLPRLGMLITIQPRIHKKLLISFQTDISAYTVLCW